MDMCITLGPLNDESIAAVRHRRIRLSPPLKPEHVTNRRLLETSEAAQVKTGLACPRHGLQH